MFPEFSSINDFTSALLIPFNLPVTKNDLSFNNPLTFLFLLSFISKTFARSFNTLIFVSFEKKLLIELTCVSPIPSIFNNSL